MRCDRSLPMRLPNRDGKCITFGQPRVTNQKGAEQLHQLPLLRVINDEDVVPLLPPLTPLTFLQGRYENFGPEIWLKPNKYNYLPDPSAEENQQNKARNIFHASLITDNFWINILQSLAKVAQKDISHSTDNIKDHFIGACGKTKYQSSWDNCDIPFGQRFRALPEGCVLF